MAKLKTKVKNIRYTPFPVARPRFIKDGDDKIILDSKTEYTLADDKMLYPSIFDKSFTLKVTTENLLFSFSVPERYRWNHADIIGVIQILALCSKDDRRVILASGIHDYMLEFKREVYKDLKAAYPGMDIPTYRRLTSEIFKFVLITQGMPKTKAIAMANVVDFFQKHFEKKKWGVLGDL